MNEQTPSTMKTAEEWKKEPAFQRQYVDVADIKQIQLDAYRAGMTEAAEIAKDMQIGCLTTTYKLACNASSEAILTARDRKDLSL